MEEIYISWLEYKDGPLNFIISFYKLNIYVLGVRFG